MRIGVEDMEDNVKKVIQKIFRYLGLRKAENGKYCKTGSKKDVSMLGKVKVMLKGNNDSQESDSESERSVEKVENSENEEKEKKSVKAPVDVSQKLEPSVLRPSSQKSTQSIAERLGTGVNRESLIL